MSMTAPWGLLLSAQSACLEKARALPDGWMSDSEQLRLSVPQSVAREASFIACRYGLRLLLAEDEGELPAWRLGSVAAQKPWVETSPQLISEKRNSLPQLSLSHSGAWLACAKAPVPIGVDFEVQRCGGRPRNVQAIAGLVFARSELLHLQQLDADGQQQYFFQLWCLKEAYFKCLGTGLDFLKIKKNAWHRTPVSMGINSKHLLGRLPVAYGRLWQASLDEDGGSLYLALCSLQALPTNIPLQMSEVAISRVNSTEWQLYEDE